jgi:putative HTH-type transcriptional regulator yciT
VLTDSSKFDKRGTVRRFALSQVYEVITDEKLSKQNIATLENAGIMVKVVS